MFFAFTLVLSIAEAYTSVKIWGSHCALFHNSQNCVDPDGAGLLELGSGLSIIKFTRFHLKGISLLSINESYSISILEIFSKVNSIMKT